MIYDIRIPNSIIIDTFKSALSYNPKERGDLFHDIRHAFKEKIEKIFTEYGVTVCPDSFLGNTYYLKTAKAIEYDAIIKNGYGYDKNSIEKIDMDFCARYGHGDYSVSAVNYLDGNYSQLPSLLAFLKVDNFSIGNILILVKNGNYEIKLNFDDGIDIAGYAYDISSKKMKSYICLFGVRFRNKFLQSIIEPYYSNCSHNNECLDEINLGDFPLVYICRICGQLFTCSCFEKHIITAINDRKCRLGGFYSELLKEKFENIKTKKNICHLCTGGIPKQNYRASTPFRQKYLPYIYLFTLNKYGKMILYLTEDEYKNREIENEVRVLFGYPKIGEKWISEINLYRVIETLFSPMKVISHYRGKELKGLEIDIWIEGLKVGVEYQGEQHYKVIEHWGGENGLKKRLANDRKKKNLCKLLGYHLVEFKYSEDLTEEYVRRKLKPFLKRKNPMTPC